MQRSALCRSRRELSNAYFLAKFGFDTAENEPYQVCPIEQCVRVSSRRSLGATGCQAAGLEGTASACRAALLADLLGKLSTWKFSIYDPGGAVSFFQATYPPPSFCSLHVFQNISIWYNNLKWSIENVCKIHWLPGVVWNLLQARKHSMKFSKDHWIPILIKFQRIFAIKNRIQMKQTTTTSQIWAWNGAKAC